MKILSIKNIIAAFILAFSIIYSLPTFFSDVPDWLTSINAKKMNLGLDLKGGVHFLMEVDLDEVTSSKSKKLITIEEYLNNKKKDQNEIFYISGDNIENLINSPQMETFISIHDLQVLRIVVE